MMLYRALKVDDEEQNQQTLTDATSLNIGNVKFVAVIDHVTILFN